MLKYTYYDDDGHIIAVVSSTTPVKEVEALKEKYDEVRYDT